MNIYGRKPLCRIMLSSKTKRLISVSNITGNSNNNVHKKHPEFWVLFAVATPIT
ncbi:hypothetical protein [Aquibacillus sediminis]|uniref:hypothetical protein n=1 Tax=Aquibacillus sediminis TaxID=2574734 RepID=UPI001486296A|nr:hypothetical protein [Aquibacillus sediminis]